MRKQVLHCRLGQGRVGRGATCRLSAGLGKAGGTYLVAGSRSAVQRREPNRILCIHVSTWGSRRGLSSR